MNAESSGGGHAVAGAVLGGTAGDGWGRAAAYDAYADGLHTYSLWYLRDHDAAADAVYCAFVAADRNHTNLQQPEQIQPWLYALLRRECRLRAREGVQAPRPVSLRLRPKSDGPGESDVTASLIQLEGNLRRAEFQSLAWPEAEGLAPAHREVLELTIRHGLDSRGLALVLGLRESAGLAPTHGFGLLADAWRELERSLAAAAVAGSGRDNCAQLAELTFGWSGKLNGTLRAPLIEHVDRCSRCQHYLHTVIGTPSAPTILPFVAAPRALRDILLGELADTDAANDAGVDVVALGARCGKFGPEGFPARLDTATVAGSAGNPPAAGAGRGPKRRQPGSPGRSGSPSAQHHRPPSAKTSLQPRSTGSGASGTATPSPTPTSAMTAAVDVDDLFRAKGSWADKVLPPPQQAGGLWRPQTSAPAPLVQTASGRFATRPPEPEKTRQALPHYARSSMATRVQPAATSADAAGIAGAEKPAVRSARHKARPMRQAVVSAMALGAIGAVAAAAAAMLGVGSHPNANTTALEGTQGSESVGTSTGSTPTAHGAGRMTVSVTTANGGGQSGLLTGASADAGLPSGGADAASATPTSASSGAFYVSVNQRAADPDSVQILLRNTGSGPLSWTAAPSESWLRLSQSSGTLAAGQAMTVTATATDGAPSGQWSAQIVFSPGGIVVTLHGGIPGSTSGAPGGGTTTGSGGTATGGGTGTGGGTPTTPTTPASPTTSPTPASPTPTASATGSTPTASATGDPSSGSQAPTPSDTATTAAPPSGSSSQPAHGH
ncbi:MAG TPA: hypothetical protein VFN97_23365 [Actinospica sp.]|nr:hypothetical protein [Actinospica sp.]